MDDTHARLAGQTCRPAGAGCLREEARSAIRTAGREELVSYQTNPTYQTDRTFLILAPPIFTHVRPHFVAPRDQPSLDRVMGVWNDLVGVE